MPAAVQSCFAKTLEFILQGPDASTNPSIVLLDYRHKDTFRDLWLNGLGSANPEISGRTVDWMNLEQQFLIVGNEPPDGTFDSNSPHLRGIDLSSHFTAASWLAAWKLRFSSGAMQTEKGAEEALGKIAVIDPREPEHSEGTTRALQIVLGALDTTENTLVPGITVLNAPSLDILCQKLSDSKQDAHTLAKDAPQVRELIKSTIWNGLISTSERHHAISNILGPVILSGKKENPNLCAETLLRRLLSACELVSWRDTETPAQGHADRQQSPVGTSEPQEEGQDLHVLLLDDQAEWGWVDWVKETLPKAAALKWLTDPKPLVEVISGALKTQDGRPAPKDARFRLNLPQLSEAANAVLLLDLRLFSGKSEAERKFYRGELLPLVNHFTYQHNLAWPGFSSENPAFRQTKEKVEKGTLEIDTDEHHEVLTWLPRVIALADMSLPIVLFSSTGRRDLVEPFKAFGNIITCFEKPRLNDLASAADRVTNVRIAAKSRLREAVRQAREWLQCRAAGRRIQRTGLDPLEQARESFKGKNHFEIYHDESSEVEKVGFKVISLLAGFPDQGEADEYDKEFPIKFYGGGCEAKAARERGDSEDLDIAQLHGDPEVERWNDVIWKQDRARTLPLLLFVCAREPDTLREGDPDSIFHPEGLDNINWDLLTLLWESLLADVLPSLLKGRNATDQITIHVYGATRQRKVPLPGNSAEDAITAANLFLERLKERWALDVLWSSHVEDEEGNWVSYPDKNTSKLRIDAKWQGDRGRFAFFWRSLKEDSFWKLVAEVLFGRKQSPRFPQISNGIKLARGQVLKYGEESLRSEGTRHLHYLADVAGRLVHADLKAKIVTVKPEVELFAIASGRGAVGFRDRMMTILNANRLLDAGDSDVEALVAFERLAHSHPPDLAFLSVAERLKERLDSIKGSDLLRMRVLLGVAPRWLASSRAQVADRIAAVPLAARRTSPPAKAVGEGTIGPAGKRAAGTPLQRQLSAEFARWKLRRFPNAHAYRENGGDWHNRQGYHVRMGKNRKITVFADLAVVPAQELSEDFTHPTTTSFKPDGSLLGEPWNPS